MKGELGEMPGDLTNLDLSLRCFFLRIFALCKDLAYNFSR